MMQEQRSPVRHDDDLAHYARVVWLRRGEVLLVTAVVVAAALVLTWLTRPTYTASVSVLVQGVTTPTSSSTTLEPPNMDTEQALVASSLQIAESVGRATGVPIDELRDRVGASVVPNTEILVISYSDTDPQRAARLARAYARAYVSFRVNQATGAVFGNRADLESQIADTQSAVADAERRLSGASTDGERRRARSDLAALKAQLTELRRRLLDLEGSEDGAAEAATVVSDAQVPTTPASPDKIENILVALAAGLLLGIAIALVRDRMDDRVDDADEAEEIVGAPLLALVPSSPSPTAAEAAGQNGHRPPLDVLDAPDAAASEAYRWLAANLVALAADHRLHSIVLTSPTRLDSKTMTVSNLAVALGETGKRVAVVSADMRSPDLDSVFVVPNEVGLAHVLTDSTPVSRAVQETEVPNVSVITSGDGLVERRPRLDAQKLRPVLAQLQSAGVDFVLIDGPPVLDAADSSVLAQVSDGTVVVAEAGSSAPDLTRSVANLRRVGATIVGTVYAAAGNGHRAHGAHATRIDS